MPEWLKGTGCKPVSSAYLGSNPSAPTSFARVAQSVEHFVGNEEVTGSSPVAGSICSFSCNGLRLNGKGINRPQLSLHGGVAQLVRAHGSYPWRHWFESSHRYHYFGWLNASRIGLIGRRSSGRFFSIAAILCMYTGDRRPPKRIVFDISPICRDFVKTAAVPGETSLFPLTAGRSTCILQKFAFKSPAKRCSKRDTARKNVQILDRWFGVGNRTVS